MIAIHVPHDFALVLAPLQVQVGILPLIIGLAAAKAYQAYSKHKAQKKAAANEKSTAIAGANLKQKMAEDKRLSNVGLGSSILGKINSNKPAYGGRLNFDTAIDPAVLAELSKRREYDFTDAVGDPGAGQGWGATSDLAGGLANIFGGAVANVGSGSVSSGAPAGGVPMTAEPIPTQLNKYNFNTLSR